MSAPASARGPEPEGPPFDILVVDDEPDLEPLVRQRMRRQVRSGRYRLHFAGDGAEALEKLRANADIDMVVTDINMPGMDGLELLRALPGVNANVKAIVVSAYGDMDNIRVAMNRGAFDFLTKPVDFDDLEVTIERTRTHILEWREALESRDRLTALENELSIASEMQRAILPGAFPEGETFDLHASMVPAREVGGDFFDLVRLERGRLGMAVADVSDKGIPAALFMMSSRATLKAAAIGEERPGHVLEEVNRSLAEDNRNTMFVTVVYAVYDTTDGHLAYANGGHCDPVVVSAEGAARRLEGTAGVVLGLAPHVRYREREAHLAPGETLVLYTDGVTEANDPDGEEFGAERLEKVFENDPPASARAASERVLAAIEAFAKGRAQRDDITCLCLHRRRA